MANELSPISKLKGFIEAEGVKSSLEKTLADSAPLFISSLLDVVGSDNRLQECAPADIVREAMKAATLKLPINRGLGFAWLVPRRSKKTSDPKKKAMEPIFQIGYKGYLQLAQRTGAYRYINAGPVFKGEFISQSKLTGEVDLSGTRESDEVVGYFAYIETLNGFRKCAYQTKDQMVAHAKKFSDSYGKDFSAWTTNPDAMGTKTVLSGLLAKYGVMSVEMADAFSKDDRDIDRTTLPLGEQPESNFIDVEPITPEGGDQQEPAAENKTATGKQPITPGF